MNIISIDLPWKPDKRGRTALAITGLDGDVKIVRASDDNELLERVRENAEPGSIILLDIPIDGCDNLGGKHFRPVDKALAHQGISIFPASKAKDRGKVLKGHLQSITLGQMVIVQEIYPYAIYKFLAYLKDRNLLKHLNLDRFDALLNNGFRAYWPPKYKRERDKVQHLENMNYLYSLLMDTVNGLNLTIPFHYPDASSNLGQLSDEYDACLGAIVGVYCANNSSYACVAGDSESGEILLLADQWLQAQLMKEVKVKKCEIGS